MLIADISFEHAEVEQSCFSVSVYETWCLADAIQVFSNWQLARSAVAVCHNYYQKLLKMSKSDLTTSDDNESCKRQKIRIVEYLQKEDIEI